jgi:hypothetical protein
MARLKTKGVSKSDIVRQYLERHPSASVMEIVTALKPYKVSEAVAAKIKYTEGSQGSAATKTKARPKATKPVASTTTKADQIREVAKGMSKPVRPIDVRAVLSANGIEVSYTQVSQVLTKMGMHKRRRRKAAVAGAAQAVASNGLSIDDLVMAKKIVGQVGSIEKVREALAALARLS